MGGEKEQDKDKLDAQIGRIGVKLANLVVLMATLILLSVYGFLTTELAVALGIGIEVVFNIDMLGFMK